MASSSPNHVHNLSAGIHRIKLNADTMIKNVCLELNIVIATVFWNIQTLKMI